MALDKLGETQEGTAWCLKALHPSDPLTEVRGIPDETCPPTTFLNFQTVGTLVPPPTVTTTWSGEYQMFPNPICFMTGVSHDTTAHDLSTSVLNGQITGATVSTKYQNLLDSYVAYRLAYAGVTIIQDGPALSNQGTIVVCQKNLQPNIYNPSVPNVNGVSYNGVHNMCLPTSSRPVFAVTQAMPNAYMSESKEGAYIPLKLTKTHQKWFTSMDNVTISEPTATTKNTYYAVLKAGSLNSWPYLDANNLSMDTAQVIPFVSGDIVPPMCSDVVADICLQNVSKETRFMCYFRYGFEVQVLPSSNLSPYLALSPRVDQSAILNYFRIARELKDAYPASYNDFGTMLSEIMSAVGNIAPGLMATNPILGALGMGVGALGKMWKGKQSAILNQPAEAQKKFMTIKNSIPAAELERTIKVVNAPKPPTTRAPRPPRQGKLVQRRGPRPSQ